MSIVLPKELSYNVLPSLPNGVNTYEQSLSPINGSSFSASTSGANIIFELPSRAGYAIPNSFYIRYKYNITSTGQSKIKGTPVYTPFQTLTTSINSQIVENISNYNVVMNMLTNCTQSVAQKYGNSVNYGWRTEGDITPSIEAFDSRSCPENDTGNLSAPLSFLYSNADKLVPTGMMGSTRVTLTLAGLADIFAPASASVTLADATAGIPASSATVLPTNLVLSEMTLCYSIIDFGEATDTVVKNMGEKIMFKSQSFMNSSSTISAGTLGALEIPFSMRLASIKSLFLINSSTSVNGIFDAFSIVGTGDTQFNIASKLYPNRPLNAGVGKSGIYMSLKSAMGSIFDRNNNFSINSLEYNRNLGTASNINVPSKHFIGVNTQLLPSNEVLLSGVSTQNSPITVRMNINTETSALVMCSLIACYDVIIEVEPSTKNVIVRQ